MKDAILIDIGSSTVKVYKWKKKSLSLLFVKSIPFKKDFNSKTGISKSSILALHKLMQEIKRDNENLPIKIYATAIFRKFEKPALNKFKQDFHKQTKIRFNIISQRQENKYLEMALVGKYNGSKKVLLINIGGGSTELVVMKGKTAIETKNIDLGVGNILSEFPNINKGKNKIIQTKIKKFVMDKLPVLKNKVKVAFLSGGELTFMQISGFNLKTNNLFKDKDHPSIILIKDYAKRNKEIFEKVYVKNLEKLMPENPTWMHGARPYGCLAQAICEKYFVEIIIPSDSNLINGVVREG